MKDVVFSLMVTLAWVGWFASFTGWLVLWIKPQKVPVAQHCFCGVAITATLGLILMAS